MSLAIVISSNLKQLIYQTVQREFVGLSPFIRLMEEALQENACSAFLHSKLDVKKAWNVPLLHAADPSGMASDARLNIRKCGFPLLADDAPKDAMSMDDSRDREGCEGKRPRSTDSEEGQMSSLRQKTSPAKHWVPGRLQFRGDELL